MAGAPAPLRRIGRWVRRIAIVVGLVLAAPYVLALVYLVVPPPSTPMLWRWVTGQPVDRRWVALDAISPNLVRAVVTSEDARFCRHWGIDLGAIRDAVRRAEATDRPIRGTSTITMQTAKNVFLWNDRSVIRKVLELPLATYIDLVWSKRRVLEVYLNIAEWGPGVYGAEAAAQYHFGVAASRLTPEQALLLATALPNPTRRVARAPTPLHRRLAERLRVRVQLGTADLSCVERAQ